MDKRIGALLLFALLTAACGGGGGGGNPTGPGDQTPVTPGGAETLVFRVSPIDIEAIRWITPLGNLNPPAHTLPTDHIYFYFANPNAGESAVARRTDFFAPADGTVTAVFTNTSIPDIKVFMRATGTINYYVDHLIPASPITTGMKITAGQRLGTTGSAFGIDLGVVNSAVTLGFVNPSRYAVGDSLHADAPLKYFEEPLRSALYDRVQRLGSERDGKIDFDVAGRLSGNWFMEGSAIPLAFAYDTYNPAEVRIAVGGGLLVTGVFAIGAGEPLPRDVSVASGAVRYTLGRAITGPIPPNVPSARLLVQMIDDQRIRVEMFALPESAEAFTGQARTFVR